MPKNQYLGPATFHFKREIPEMFKAIPTVEITGPKTVFIPYTSITPRIESIDLAVHGITHSFSKKTVQKVEGSKGKVIFGEE